jgi:hypothetical protein
MLSRSRSERQARNHKLRKLRRFERDEIMADQEVYVELAAKAVGVSTKAVDDLVNNAADLFKNIAERFTDIKKADPLTLAEYIFRWFSNGAGAKFFKTSDKKVCFSTTARSMKSATTWTLIP